MLIAALEAEVEAYIEQHAHLRDENGHALVVRNGKARKRTVHCGVGSLKIRAPRVHDKVPASTLRARYCHPTCAAPHNWKAPCPSYTSVACPPATFARLWPPC